MTDLIEKVKCSITITLSNNTTITIALDETGEPTNYATGVEVTEETGTENNNPVGVVSSNLLKLAINTKDLSLIPQNKQSPYYGFMNNTATVTVTVETVDGLITFETFYVNDWKSNISSSNPYGVIINCVDLMSLMNKNSTPPAQLVKQQATGTYLLNILTKLNENLPEKYHVETNITDGSFRDFYNIQYPIFSEDTMAVFLNTISQCTLTNFYLNRSNILVADNLLDDSEAEAVATLSDSVNVFSASLDSQGMVNYSAVKVNYFLYTINDTSLLTSLDSQTLEIGDNPFTIPLSNVFKVNYIKVITDGLDKVETTGFSYSKDSCNLILTSTEATTCTIEIYGQTLRENKMSLTVSRENSSNETLEVTNRLLPESSISTFANKLLEIVDVRGQELTLEGFFNPALKLGDIVNVDCRKSINTSGRYKIIALKWKITSTIKCTCKLIKIQEEE